MNATETGVLVVGGCAVFSALVWCAALALSSWASGWRRLARAFGNASLIAGAPTRFLSARIGHVEYSGILNAGAGDFGLALIPMRMFRPFHPPLFIPWVEMETEPLADTLSSGVRLAFPSVRGVRLHISGRTLDLVRPYLGRVRTAPARFLVMIDLRRIERGEGAAALAVLDAGSRELWGLDAEQIRARYDPPEDLVAPAAHYADRRGAFLVLVDEVHVIGTGGIADLGAETAELKGFGILKAYRGKGLGRGMVEGPLVSARLGFRSIDRYRDGPCGLSMERDL